MEFHEFAGNPHYAPFCPVRSVIEFLQRNARHLSRIDTEKSCFPCSPDREPYRSFSFEKFLERSSTRRRGFGSVSLLRGFIHSLTRINAETEICEEAVEINDSPVRISRRRSRKEIISRRIKSSVEKFSLTESNDCTDFVMFAGSTRCISREKYYGKN